MGWPTAHCRFLGIGLMILLAGCGLTPSDRPADGRLPVFAGIPPVAYVVEQIGGEHVKVGSLVQPGQDPHTFECTPQQVLTLSRAVVFFKVDMPFENVLLKKVQQGNPRLRIVDVTRGVKKRNMDAGYGESSVGPGHGEEPGPGEPDPHVWLSPPLVKIQAENVAAALCEADPDHQREYRQNLAALQDRLDELHRRVQRLLAPYRGRSFYVFHPGFGYFADAYGLKQEAVELGGRPPTLKQLRALSAHARADGVKVILVQPQFASQSAQAIADAIGGKVAPIDGLGKDVIRDIEDIAEKIENSMRESSPRRHGVHGGNETIGIE
jgi:zinc transport system substrate-binding protein